MSRVLVVEDEQTLAGALQVALDVQPDMACVGAVATVEAAASVVASQEPDVVLMDIQLPGAADGIEGTRRVKASRPRTRVLILTGHATPDRLSAAAAAGAAGFLSKDSAFPDILAAIRTSGEERMLVEPAALRALLADLRDVEPAAGRGTNWAGLTPRELAVLGLMGQGLSPFTIASRLVVSVHTARGHVKNIMMKTGAHSQLEAVVIAIKTGLLPASERPPGELPGRPG